MVACVIEEPSTAAPLRHRREIRGDVETLRVDASIDVQGILLFANGIDAPVHVVGNHPEFAFVFLPDSRAFRETGILSHRNALPAEFAQQLFHWDITIF